MARHFFTECHQRNRPGCFLLQLTIATRDIFWNIPKKSDRIFHNSALFFLLGYLPLADLETHFHVSEMQIRGLKPISDAPKMQTGGLKPISDAPKMQIGGLKPISDTPKMQTGSLKPISDTPKMCSQVGRGLPTLRNCYSNNKPESPQSTSSSMGFIL
jgi:hypothetical protein